MWSARSFFVAAVDNISFVIDIAPKWRRLRKIQNRKYIRAHNVCRFFIFNSSSSSSSFCHIAPLIFNDGRLFHLDAVRALTVDNSILIDWLPYIQVVFVSSMRLREMRQDRTKKKTAESDGSIFSRLCCVKRWEMKSFRSKRCALVFNNKCRMVLKGVKFR